MSLFKRMFAGLVTMSFVVAPALARPQFSAMTVDARNGKILYADDIDGLRHPASLTKMMTLYLVFQDLKSGRISRDTKLRVSARASRMPPSKLFLKAGDTITVDEAIKALVIKSANDVASTVGENLGGGSEAKFAARMTKVARAIGMNKTRFGNASGLPHPAQVTTARDMATLGLRLMRDFPQYYPYFRLTSARVKGRTLQTHNALLKNYAGTDGIKTGYIATSGFNLVTSTRKGDRRLVGVVLGARSSATRGRFMRKMLESKFAVASGGNTVAALPGTSKGIINPVGKASADPVATATIAGLETSAVPEKTKDVKISGANDAPATLPTTLATTWAIDVGSFSDKTSAEDRIATLRGLMGQQLDGIKAFTMQEDAKGKVSFSARFGGFDDAKAAKKACAKAEKIGSSCRAIAPEA